MSEAQAPDPRHDRYVCPRCGAESVFTESAHREIVEHGSKITCLKCQASSPAAEWTKKPATPPGP
jgi:ribosomal protein L40E